MNSALGWPSRFMVITVKGARHMTKREVRLDIRVAAIAHLPSHGNGSDVGRLQPRAVTLTPSMAIDLSGSGPLRGADLSAGSSPGPGAGPHGHVHRAGHPLLQVQAPENARAPGALLVSHQHPKGNPALLEVLAATCTHGTSLTLGHGHPTRC